MSNLARAPSSAAIHPALIFGGTRLRGMTRRVAAGADLLLAARRRDIARVLICWGDLRRG